MKILCVCLIGMILDWIFGDPVWLYHPVRIIGKWISFLEKILRKFAGDQEGNEKKLLIAGGILWILVILTSAAVPMGILYLAEKLSPCAAFVLECFWCYQLLAARSLGKESKKVYKKLIQDDLSGARLAVSMIVGRDTENLTVEGVTKAAVETVAENTNDGVIAPLIYMLIGGPILGFVYKAVNTMDSMLGYKNEKYLYFGRVAAKMDDVAGFIPARISALLMILASCLLGMDGKNALWIWKRDRRKHASPNAAQTEAVCAGALQVQLAGDAWYFGKKHEKDTIGDPIRNIEPKDILRSEKLMIGTEVLTFLLFGGIRLFF
ncbi:adenosylcobinamide-phosphate synthase CbiB [Dorea sp. AF36-15AT]|uniref:adenosylcobinamide-phosphate synthase CbiB n=1 Tax=Dorea sp. AF36-15AT TaxID=2292041 RepID=UPI000E4C4C4F|nr:adenosylcobinamide-phosphate synthase CbiB [Dorea sp. AF36-15AT]RHP07841.1 cobalamin biosynthesis protein CobD [Dorea sp. AF36-15AT]